MLSSSATEGYYVASIPEILGCHAGNILIHRMLETAIFFILLRITQI